MGVGSGVGGAWIRAGMAEMYVWGTYGGTECRWGGEVGRGRCTKEA